MNNIRKILCLDKNSYNSYQYVWRKYICIRISNIPNATVNTTMNQARPETNVWIPVNHQHSHICRNIQIGYVTHGPRKGAPIAHTVFPLQWRHNQCDGVSNHRRLNCLPNRLIRCISKKNNNALRHWPLWGEFTGDRWIPRTKGQ